MAKKPIIPYIVPEGETVPTEETPTEAEFAASPEATQELPSPEGTAVTVAREGALVHYVMTNGEHRPAIVVRVWRNLDGTHAGLPLLEGLVNLQVFTDGANDQNPAYSSGMNERVASGLLWATSVRYSDQHEAGTWHWMEEA